MSITNILSALGNNNSIWPLFVRDCGIENVAKVTMTYKQNAKESKFIAKQATRERFIDEYGTSAVWLGGIPLIEKLSDTFIKSKGFSPEISTKLFKETQNQGLNTNIKKFKDVASKEVNELIFLKNNKNKFKSLQVGKLIASTLIPIAVMGFILPKVNFNFTKKKMEEEKKKDVKNFIKIDEFIKNTSSSPSFTGNFDILNISQLQKMLLLDGGLSLGRIKTGRNKDEKEELALKMAGMCYLNYIAPKKIEKGLNNVTKKIFKINTQLDPKILKNPTFINDIKENKFVLPKDTTEKAIIDFFDTKPESTFSQMAKEQGLVKYLPNNIRDPRKYVEIEKVNEFVDSIKDFINDSKKSDSLENFVKKAYKAKAFNIIANVAISSFLLAIALPKVQFLFRKLKTGSSLEPGLKNEK